MTTPHYTGDPGPTGVEGEQDAKEQAKQTAGTATEESRHVAGVAKDEAQNVAAEARQQARTLKDEAMTQVDEQSRTQRDRLVDTLRTFSDDLEQMASQGGRSGMATDLTRQVAGKARELGSQLDGREPTDLLDDVRSFARRRPGAFLLGAVAAGVVAGRLTRGTKDASSGGSSPRSVYDDPRGTATGDPIQGTGYPAGDPAYPSGVSGVSAEGATGEALDPEIGATPATPGGARGSNVAEEPWTTDPNRRGAM
jgi:vacuolar-type H+-ATPase subunit H